jgi:hypothetical protein
MKQPMGEAFLQVLGRALVVATTSGCLDSAGEPEPEQTAAPLIFGNDDRAEYPDPGVTDRVRGWADAVGTFSHVSQLSSGNPGEGGLCSLQVGAYLYGYINGQWLELCDDTRFKGDQAFGTATGFLVAPDLVITAGHVLPANAIGAGCDPTSGDPTTFMFGWQNTDTGGPSQNRPCQDIYRCINVVDSDSSGNGDWAIVRLDRPVRGRTPLIINYSGTAASGAPLTAIGYPDTLPLKIAAGGFVKSVASPWLSYSCDVFGNNSGSPLIDSTTGVVEGIHHGEDMADAHYVQRNDPAGACATPRVCSETTGCDGVWSYGTLTRVPAATNKVPLHAALTVAAMGVIQGL